MKNLIKSLFLVAIIGIAGCNMSAEQQVNQPFKAKQVFKVPERQHIYEHTKNQYRSADATIFFEKFGNFFGDKKIEQN